jgi:hypothetical protein
LENVVGVMSQKYIPTRDSYKPVNRIRFMLIAESPPASGGYFYFDKATGRDSLFRETMKALRLFPEDSKMPEGFDKTPLLKEFRRLGFFLVDASYTPVNGLSNNERRRVIIREIPRLVDEIRKLGPERIIIVKASIFPLVKSALGEAGFGDRILNEEALPFPSHGHQKKYRQMLRNLILSKQ